MNEEDNEITLNEYIEQVEEAIREIKIDMGKAQANLIFCLDTLKEMKTAEWMWEEKEKEEFEND